MKKRMLLFLLMLLLPLNVFGASGSVKASASSTKVTLNNTVTVTVKVSSSDILGSWQFGLSYDKSKLSLVSGDTNIVGYGDGTFSSKSYTYKFKAIAAGSASITVDNPKIVDWNTDSYITTTSSNLTLTIKEAVVVNYSSDNNLKSLEVDGFEISPEFNKSTLSYNVSVLATTTMVNIKASTSDSKAKVSGTGNKEVAEGDNAFSIVVTAENGSTKTYTLNVYVPEKDPIKYTFNGTEYSILRKLPEDLPENFNTSTIMINNEEVPCLQNEKLNLTLIYLRDSNNKENFYIYNSNQSISLYNEIKGSSRKIYLMTAPNDISGMIKTSVEINEQEIMAYQIRSESNNYIIYGKDIENGTENFYVYDKEEGTLSLYYQDDIDYLTKDNDLYKLIAYILGGLIVILLIIIILINNSKKKLMKFIEKKESKSEVKEKEPVKEIDKEEIKDKEKDNDVKPENDKKQDKKLDSKKKKK
jgi:hypothetical protein